uniref:Dolichyl-diphosphooligosaccharide--protein glycosyltransferase subunit 1 n=1 Tax=Macaca nemestrina TaxID=9545 RepID=A0A2K6CNK4_MACNE
MEAPVARLFLLLLLGSWTPAPGSASSEAPPLINEDVKRTVDLSSHLAKVTAEVVLAHLGGSSTSRATSFLLALEPELEARLAHLGVQVSMEFHFCCPGWRAMALSWLTAASISQVQAVLLL